jgi:hypothetical protein
MPDMSDRLKQKEETELLEELGITSEMIVDRFQDIIEEKFDQLQQTLTWEDTDDGY